MAGILTKGIKLGYSANGEGTYTDLTNLMEIPEIGNSAPEKIDITTLADDVKKSMAGLGDSAQDLAFKFLYEEEQFNTLMALVGTTHWQVSMPGDNGVKATFTGTPSVKFDSAAPNNAVTYTLTIGVESKINFA